MNKTLDDMNFHYIVLLNGEDKYEDSLCVPHDIILKEYNYKFMKNMKSNDNNDESSVELDPEVVEMHKTCMMNFTFRSLVNNWKIIVIHSDKDHELSKDAIKEIINNMTNDEIIKNMTFDGGKLI